MTDALPTFRHRDISLMEAGLSFDEMTLRGELPAWLPGGVVIAPVLPVVHNDGAEHIGLARLCRVRGVAGIYARVTIQDDTLRQRIAAQGPSPATVTPVWGRDGEAIVALSVNSGAYRDALGGVTA